MVQALWYVRKADTVSGPFPARQIAVALSNGELARDDDISLDGEQWLSIEASGQFPIRSGGAQNGVADPAWRSEREKARSRWQRDEVVAIPGASPPESSHLRSLAADHDTTRALLDAESRRRPSLIVALLGVLLLAGVAVLIWLGDGSDSVRASLGKAAVCAAPAAPGASWAGCAKPGVALAAADLRGMDFQRTRLEGARFAGANLSYADFSRAVLRGADFSGANLMGAKFAGADLTGCDLRRADLRYATLTGALIDGMRYEGAVLGRTAWIDGTLCETAEQCR
jgi:hypothetical protein